MRDLGLACIIVVVLILASYAGTLLALTLAGLIVAE